MLKKAATIPSMAFTFPLLIDDESLHGLMSLSFMNALNLLKTDTDLPLLFTIDDPILISMTLSLPAFGLIRWKLMCLEGST